MIYLDYISIFSKAPEEHITYIKMTLTPLKKASETLKLKNGDFFTNRMDCLGHLIKSGRFEVYNHTTPYRQHYTRIAKYK